jgi:hypothetical protein
MNYLVFKKGIPLPFGRQELETRLIFNKGWLAIWFELEDDAAVLLEERFWDDEAKKKKGIFK